MKLTQFRVTNYRNVRDSGWITVNDISAFVGQNEAGKSNLFEALYRINPFVPNETYSIDEDWPVDDWGNKDPSALVCKARFDLNVEEVKSLWDTAGVPEPEPDAPGDGEEAGQETNAAETQEPKLDELPAALTLVGSRSFETGPTFSVEGDNGKDFDSAEVAAWAEKHIPKFVLIQDYGLSGTQIELNTLAERCKQIKWHELTNDEQTIKYRT